MIPKQETFDTVARHLLRQGKQSKGRYVLRSGEETGGCMYRGENGTMCAAGCLIPDDEYSPHMENIRVRLLRGSPSLMKHDVDLVARLQVVHDNRPPYEWVRELRSVAADLGLSTAVLDEPREVQP